jgi:hypothetical protein
MKVYQAKTKVMITEETARYIYKKARGGVDLE